MQAKTPFKIFKTAKRKAKKKMHQFNYIFTPSPQKKCDD
jgi:hypothetical protein